MVDQIRRALARRVLRLGAMRSIGLVHDARPGIDPRPAANPTGGGALGNSTRGGGAHGVARKVDRCRLATRSAESFPLRLNRRFDARPCTQKIRRYKDSCSPNRCGTRKEVQRMKCLCVLGVVALLVTGCGGGS